MRAIRSFFLDIAQQKHRWCHRSHDTKKNSTCKNEWSYSISAFAQYDQDHCFFLHSRTVFYLSEQHGLWTDCILTEELTMHKMIPTDFVLTLPNILGHKCTCIKSHDQSRLIPPRVRQEFFYTLLGMQEMPVHSGLNMQHISSHFTFNGTVS